MTMKKMRRILTVLLIAALALAVFSACGETAPAQQPATPPPAQEATPAPPAEEPAEEPAPVFSIGIINLVEHPALYAAREGFLTALRAEGIEFVYDYQNAQGDIATLSTIAQRFISNDVDLILAITTPGVQTMAAAT